MKKMKFWGILLPIFVGMLVSSCQQNADDQMIPGEKSGVLTIKITDAPFHFGEGDSANVTISSIKLKKQMSDGEEAGDSEGFIVMEIDTTINICKLQNGTSEILTKLEVPTGIYKEIRMIITEANVVLKNEDETYETYDMKVPSGSSSGLKIKIQPALTVLAGAENNLLLDFDLSRSFKAIGNEHSHNKIKFHFSPVVRAVNENETGGVYGVVRDTSVDTTIVNAMILLLQGEDTITSTYTSEDGYYAMIGIDPGEYSMRCEAENVDTVSIQNVMVKLNNLTEQNFELPQLDN